MLMIKVRIKKNLDTSQKLQDAGVPRIIVDSIMGDVVRLTDDFAYATKLRGVSSQWLLPPECVEIISTKN